MSSEEQRAYRTLRGALEGQEPEEEIYFAHSATLRIFGQIDDLDEISRSLGLSPTESHRRGEQRRPGAKPYEHDMWRYEANVPEDAPLQAHIEALWTAIKGKKSHLLRLKQTLTVDVFLGYRSNCDHAGIEVPHTCLEMFTELQIPFGVSIVIA